MFTSINEKPNRFIRNLRPLAFFDGAVSVDIDGAGFVLLDVADEVCVGDQDAALDFLHLAAEVLIEDEHPVITNLHDLYALVHVLDDVARDLHISGNGFDGSARLQYGAPLATRLPEHAEEAMTVHLAREQKLFCRP